VCGEQYGTGIFVSSTGTYTGTIALERDSEDIKSYSILIILFDSNFTEEGATVLVRPAPQIVDCLNNQEFETFVKHVEGLVSVYSLNCTPVEKSRAWQGWFWTQTIRNGNT
jgi:hypothetical protein